MFSDTPSSSSPALRRLSNSGFTLIELLMVIAVIMVLAGITFGISRGVQNAQARAQVKAELAVIAQGIEQFKLRYGDYPWHQTGETDTNKTLLYALTGRLIMERDSNGNVSVTIISEDMDNPEVQKRPKFIDETKLTVIEDGSGNSTGFIDPWGNPYMYWYKWEKTPNNWQVFGYHLYSMGSDGNESRAGIGDQSGVMDANYRDANSNIDNIYSGE